jgi:anthranilate phosphoribosyltransferase
VGNIIHSFLQHGQLAPAHLPLLYASLLDGAMNEAETAGLLALVNQTLWHDAALASAHLDAALAALEARWRAVESPMDTLDVCGTGGDGLHTLNVSTATALVVAACGVPVAKHGNRSASSKSGAADVLEALGVPLESDPAALTQRLLQTGLVFLFAPHHHPSLKTIALVRKALGVPTLFNLLGPLANPARPSFQLIGVANPAWLSLMANAAARQPTLKAAWLVRGEDGMDELSISAPSVVWTVESGTVIAPFTLHPSDAGLPLHPAAALSGGDAAHNAQAPTVMPFFSIARRHCC